MKYVVSVALLLCVFLMAVSGMPVRATTPVVISELQVTGCHEYQANNSDQCAVEEPSQEFIELYNMGVVDSDVTGWRVEYLSASHNGAGAPTRVIYTLRGKITAGTHILLSFKNYIQNADDYFGVADTSGYLAKSGGRIRLVDASGSLIDMVSWGSASQLSGGYKIGLIPAGQSARRLLPGEPNYQPDSPFVIDKLPTPEGGGLQDVACEGILLSEILANPTGVDSTAEFIEIYNPSTAEISLAGCSIRLNEGAAVPLTGSILAGSYRKLATSELGLTLPNNTGATVWLITDSTEEGIQYPADMTEGTAWARFIDNWKVTAQPTPAAENFLKQPGGGKGGGSSLLPCPAGKYRHPETNRCRSTNPTATTKPCRPDQERNPLTNRCRLKSATAVGLTPCKPGQVRNAETNRCRSTTTSATLTPCKPGQTRNPATNRCRSATTASAALTPCKPNQERNPETNRCRKKTMSSDGANYKVEQTPPAPGAPIGWLLAGTAGVGAAGYGVYEWRREIGSFITRLKDKISGGPAP